jgi:hypothetical protein
VCVRVDALELLELCQFVPLFCFHVSHYTYIIGISQARSLVIPELSQSF